MGSDWVTTTIAGSGYGGLADGTNRAAAFWQPWGVAVDSGGALYVADSWNHCIRRLAPAGTNWVTTTIAGMWYRGIGFRGSRDGTNNSASFDTPRGVAVGPSGAVYVADTGNHTIRRLTLVGTNWVTETIGGLALSPGADDGVGAGARFNQPTGIAVLDPETVLVGDIANYTVRLGTAAFPLKSSAQEDRLVLSWPRAASNYVLETTFSLDPGGSWSPVTSGVVLSVETFVVTNTKSADRAFFRLRK